MLEGRALDRFLNGDIKGFHSQKAADLEYCKIAYHLKKGDPREIDNFYRKWPAKNPKWDDPTEDGLAYGKKIIAQAIIEESGKGKIREEKDQQNDALPCELSLGNDECSTSIEFPDGHTEYVHLTDSGNARRFAAAAKGDFKYCASRGWLHWDGKRWSQNAEDTVNELAKAVGLNLHSKGQAMTDNSMRQNYIKWGLNTESAHRITAMIELARTEPSIWAKIEDFDRDVMLFNCDNGTLDLKTGELRPHRRKDFLTHISPIAYDPEADCPNWKEHLNTIFQENESLISFFQVACGYSMTGLTGERAFFILWGSGKNGKSTTIEVIAQIMGDYAKRIPVETIMLKQGTTIPSDLASLKGKRLVYTSETEEGKRLAESLIKDITGGDTIAARFLYKEWFTFKPEFKIFLSTNHKPIIKGTDTAIWDRVRLIPFTYQIPEENRRPMETLIEQKFKPEFPGILRWMVEGYKDFKIAGLFTPDEVKMATCSYQEEMDLINEFIKTCCIVDKRAEVTSRELYDAYRDWCKENGEYELTNTKFGRRLEEKGFLRSRPKGQKGWQGIGLATDGPNS